jgi:hypothetical protein
MEHLVRTSVLAALLTALACGADVQFPGQDPNDQTSQATGEACNSLVNKVYTTIADQQGGTRCGYDALGFYGCPDTYGAWLVSFGDDGNVFWSTGESTNYGPYTCRNGEIRANFAHTREQDHGRPVEGTINGKQLTFNDLIYVLAE